MLMLMIMCGLAIPPRAGATQKVAIIQQCMEIPHDTGCMERDPSGGEGGAHKKERGGKCNKIISLP